MATEKVAPISLAMYVQFRLPIVDCVTFSAQNTRVFLSSNYPCLGIYLCRSCIRYHRSEQMVQKHHDLRSQIGHIMCSHLNYPDTHTNCKRRVQATCVRYRNTMQSIEFGLWKVNTPEHKTQPQKFVSVLERIGSCSCASEQG